LGDRVRVTEWPPRDQAGAIEPHRHNAITAFRSMPWLVKAFDRIVPEAHWHPYTDPKSDESIAVIECQCGETVWTGGARMAECACHRFFLLVGDELRCYRPDAEAISALEEPDDGGDS
jgi:hypothetical protein